MSDDRTKLDERLDAWLKQWPVPERRDEDWEAIQARIDERIAEANPGQGDDAWLAAPLPAVPGESGAAPMSKDSSEVRMSEPSPDKAKRKSLKDIAQRVSAAPPAPSSAADAKPSPSVPSPRPSNPDLVTRPAFPSRSPEARDSDSGILDLAAVRASQASLPDSGAAPGSAGLFEDDKAPAAAAPATPVQQASKSSNLIPLLGGGVVAIAAIAAAFFMVVKSPASKSEGMAPAAPAAAASLAQNGAADNALPAATAAAGTASGEALAAATEAPATGAGDPGAARGGAAAEPGKAAAKEAEPKGGGDKPESADTAKTAAGPAPTDLGGAMATAVGANTSEPTPDKKDQPSAAPPSGSIPEAPSQGAIQGALGSVMGAAKGCVTGMDEPSRATVVFGSSGRVKSVSVTGPASKTGAAGCIKSALSKASVGPFQRDSYSVGVTIRP